MPTQLYRRIKRERWVTYALWVVMVGLLAWGVLAWVDYLSTRAELAEREAERMAELVDESEKTQRRLAELIASFEAREERTRAQRQRFRQDVNAILKSLGIEVREEAVRDAEPSGGSVSSDEGARTSSITLRDTAAGRIVRRTLRLPPPEPDEPAGPPPESVPRPHDHPPSQRAPPSPEPAPAPAPAPEPRGRPEPQPPQAQNEPREPGRAPQASERGERGPPDHAEAKGQSKPKTRPDHARGRSGTKGPPDHAQGSGPPDHAKQGGKR